MTRSSSGRGSRPRTAFTLSEYSTFSIAVSDGKRLNCWKTNPSERRRMPTSVLLPARTPSIVTSPPVGVRMQPRIERKVVFPEPDGPSSATISPRSISKLMPLRTRTLSRPSAKSLMTLHAWSMDMITPSCGSFETAIAERRAYRRVFSNHDAELPSEDERRIDRRHLAERHHGRGETEHDRPDEDGHRQRVGDDQLEIDFVDERLHRVRHHRSEGEAGDRGDQGLLAEDRIDVAVAAADGLHRAELPDVLHRRGVERLGYDDNA